MTFMWISLAMSGPGLMCALTWLCDWGSHQPQLPPMEIDR